jgi:hypothetical protein
LCGCFAAAAFQQVRGSAVHFRHLLAQGNIVAADVDVLYEAAGLVGNALKPAFNLTIMSFMTFRQVLLLRVAVALWVQPRVGCSGSGALRPMSSLQYWEYGG